jgi:hypothetical protein
VHVSLNVGGANSTPGGRYANNTDLANMAGLTDAAYNTSPRPAATFAFNAYSVGSTPAAWALCAAATNAYVGLLTTTPLGRAFPADVTGTTHGPLTCSFTVPAYPT